MRDVLLLLKISFEGKVLVTSLLDNAYATHRASTAFPPKGIGQ